MTDEICTACGRKSSEHILCSYDKVTLYCPGDKDVMSKDDELELIKMLLNTFDELDLTEETFRELGLIDNSQPLESKGDK